jgi:hypothetical protein
VNYQRKHTEGTVITCCADLHKPDVLKKNRTNCRQQLVKSIRCFCCGETRSENDLSRCSGCRLAYYCNKKCQKKHWKNGHKKVCKKK